MEFAVMASVFILVIFGLVAYGGAIAEAEGDVQSAAQNAARAASLVSQGRAPAEARAVANANLAAAGRSCRGGRSVAITAWTHSPGTGGYVEVTVTCTVDLGDIAPGNAPGSRTIVKTAREVVDTFRGGS
ncbi:MAG: pilus assembly protein [Acidimicrobiales bacterium]|nr:pilus assembly protein [Acidimicrobiales bacterium]